MKFKKLNEDLSYDELYDRVADFVAQYLIDTMDNFAMIVQNEVDGYDADYCAEEPTLDGADAERYIKKAAESYAAELMWNAEDYMNESCHSKKKKSLNEKSWKKELRSGVKLRKAIDREDYAEVKSALIDCYKELHDMLPEDFDEDDLEDKLDELEILDTAPDSEIDISEQDIEDNWNYELSDFYDFCDAFDVWVSLD